MTTTYILELTEEELFDLWFRLVVLEKVGRLHNEEVSILEKDTRLMEGK